MASHQELGDGSDNVFDVDLFDNSIDFCGNISSSSLTKKHSFEMYQ